MVSKRQEAADPNNRSRRAGQRSRSGQKLAQATIDALSAHICVLDEAGVILSVNQAWREFADANAQVHPNYWIGANYLEVCDAARGQDAEEAAAAARGIRAVMRHATDFFELEYPCHSPDAKRWFTVRVTRLADDGPARLVLAHENITGRRQAEVARRESEVQYRLIVDHANEGIWVLNETFSTTFVNGQMAQMLGYPPEAMLGQPMSAYIVSEEAADHAHEMQERQRGLRGHYERRFRRKDASTLWASVSAVPLMDAAGQFRGSFGMLTDITERKRAEEALQASEAKYRTLVETMAESAVLHDAQGAIIACNIQAEHLLGLPAAQLMGCTPLDPRWHIIREDGSPFPNEARPSLITLRTGRPCSDVVMGIYSAGGDLSWVIVNARPILRPGTLQPEGVVVTCSDITARRREEEKWRNLFEILPVGVSIVTPDHAVMEFNSALSEILGISEAGLLKGDYNSRRYWRPDHTPMSPAEFPSLRAIDERVVIRDVEIGVEKEDGALVWTSVSAAPLSRQPGSVTVTTDITRRIRAEQDHGVLLEAVRRAHAQLRSLSSDLITAQETERRRIAHELHDEIGQVILAVKTKLETIQLTVESATQAARVAEAISTVASALEQVRALALNLRPSLLDDFGLAAALEWYLERQARSMPFKIDFQSEVGERRFAASVETAGFRIVQAALTNIARHAQAQQAEVRLRLIPERGELELSVRDDGIGFDVPDAFTRAQHGQSLGLLGMQERVHLAGGRLSVESAPGHGTDIRARFPLEAEGGQA